MHPAPVTLGRRSLIPDSVGSSAWIGLFALILAVSPFAARADDDLPGRVGRIAEFAGELFLSPEDRATEWEAVGLNYPVISGDNLWVSGDGRAEVDYGGGQFRLAGDTNLHVSRLDDRQIALFLAQGRLIVRVRVLDTGDAARVDTPNTQVTLNRPGLYRIEVTPDRQHTTVVVREGEAIVALANGAQQALPGQTATVSGPDPADADVRNTAGTDGFDTWSANRDRRYERARSTAHVSRQMVGYADLDEYGTWQATPEYGAVWYPTTVAADWAPYRDGYWANIGGWGYTWVDYAPWGYAPFHYGRWIRIGGRWAWSPGRYVARPVWAPALVGWVGGAGWGLSVTTGAPVFGWVPLGWGEPYLPWWRRCSHNCWTHYNRPYNVNVAVRPSGPPPRYTHFGVPGAITAVSAPTITHRRPVPGNLVQVSPSVAASAPVMATAPTVMPAPVPAPHAKPGVGSAPPPASAFIPRSRKGGPDVDAGSRVPPRPPAAQAGPSTGPSAGPSTVTSGTPSAAMPAPAPTRRPPREASQPAVVQSPAPVAAPSATPRTPPTSAAPVSPTPPPAATVSPTPPSAAMGSPTPPPPAAAGSQVPRAVPSSPTVPQPSPSPRWGSPHAPPPETASPAASPAGTGRQHGPPPTASPRASPSPQRPSGPPAQAGPAPVAPPATAAPPGQPATVAPAPQGTTRETPGGREGSGRGGRGGEKADANPGAKLGAEPK